MLRWKTAMAKTKNNDLHSRCVFRIYCMYLYVTLEGDMRYRQLINLISYWIGSVLNLGAHPREFHIWGQTNAKPNPEDRFSLPMFLGFQPMFLSSAHTQRPVWLVVSNVLLPWKYESDPSPNHRPKHGWKMLKIPNTVLETSWNPQPAVLVMTPPRIP